MSCGATMQSRALPDHVHTCAVEHDAGDHVCSDPTCRRWFGVAS